VNVNINAAENALPLWEQCIQAYLLRNPDKKDVSGLEAIKHVSAENGALSLEAPSEFAKEWFLWHFRNVFLEIARSIDPGINEISVFAPKIKEKARLQAPSLQVLEKLKTGKFCKKYSLNNFVAETSNELALKSACFIAATPRTQDNFLVIKGAAGLGKTHLLHAIGNEASINWAKKAVLWDSDRFFKEKRNGNLSMLHQADILLFDDLQNLYSSESAQKDLLDIFKNLRNRGRSIVISINPKSKIKGALLTEMQDFLKMGIKCELKSPDLQTRIAILRQKAKERGLPVATLESSWKLIAEKFGESVCSLEGAINHLVARHALLKCNLNPQIVRSIYEEPCNTANEAATIESIAIAAALAYNIPLESLRGKSRMAKVNKPRQMAVYLCKQVGFSLSKIGEFFNRDASSIINAIQKIKGNLASENGYALKFELEDILRAAGRKSINQSCSGAFAAETVKPRAC